MNICLSVKIGLTLLGIFFVQIIDPLIASTLVMVLPVEKTRLLDFKDKGVPIKRSFLFSEENVLKALNQLMQAHETLLIAMPKTALGWQQQLIFGFALMLLALVINRNWRKFNVNAAK